MSYELLLVSVFVSTVALTWVIQRFATQLSLIDIPNIRSSHKVPTPRGGGVAIFLCFSIALLVICKSQTVQLRDLVEFLLLGGATVTLVGLLDDYMGVPSPVRFCVHSVVAACVVTSMEPLPSLFLFDFKFSFGWFAYLVYTLAIIWLLNLYNFMDGIDGIASSEAICVSCSAAFILTMSGHPQEGSLLIMLALACLGFLIWNWPPARIFLGDAGSGYLGFVFSVFALYTSSLEGVNLWTWVILLGVFWVDATCTLLWRIFTGQRWGQAHRAHLYQVMSRKWDSHRKVTIAVIAINAFWLFPWALMTSLISDWAFIFVIIAVSPLVFLVFIFGLQKS